MPRERTQQVLNVMTVTEYLDAQRDYRNYDPMGNSMSTEEYEERTEYEHKLQARHSNDLFDQRANLAANFSGHPPRARDPHDYYASGSSHDRGDRHGVGRERYEDSLDNESADGRHSRPGARPESGAASAYPSGHGDIDYPTDTSGNFEEPNHPHGVPPSARRDGRSLEGRLAAESLLTATSSHHYESQQDPHSQHRDDSYDSDGSSTVRPGRFVAQEGRRSARHSPAGDHHRQGP